MRAFVIMPFENGFDDIFKIGIKQTAKECGVDAYRLDEELFEEGMLEKIFSEIVSSDFIIADLSNKNPNVFYELGYAQAIGKLCILITKDAQSIPFDLKHKRHVVYGDSIVHLKEQLEKNIEWAKKETELQKSNPFEIELKSYGNLSTTEEYAEAIIDLTIDIENKSNRVSPEIYSIYLHSTKNWEMKQNGNKVTFRPSELKSYSFCYSLFNEQKKIPKKGWTQIQISATRIIANFWQGDEIKDRYTIHGNMLLEILTDKGSYTKLLPININIGSLPF